MTGATWRVRCRDCGLTLTVPWGEELPGWGRTHAIVPGGLTVTWWFCPECALVREAMEVL